MAAGDVDVKITAPDARKCASFDGVDDRVTIAITKTFTEMTLGMWINLKNVAKNRNTLTSEGLTGPNSLWLNVGLTAEKLDMYLGETTNPGYHTSTKSLLNNTWHHVAMTFSNTASTAKLYIDGVEDTSITTNGLVRLNNIHIGVDDNLNANFFTYGSIKKTILHERALTATEILKLSKNEPVSRLGLVGEWKLEDDYKDTSGQGNDGTNNGSVLRTIDDSLTKAVADQRTAATDTFFLCDVNGGSQVLHTQITEA